MPPSAVLNIDLGERSYPIAIGQQWLSASAEFLEEVCSGDVVVVTNQAVASLYLDPLKAVLGDRLIHTIFIGDGERFKTIDTYVDIMSALLEKGIKRNGTLIALGGGVVGDITGFVAATYQRGIPFVQVPTTLLAQVDSSVGGKTAVNHPLGKNMIGAFYQPKAVLIDVATLETLPARELAAGLMEVIKYGFIMDAGFYQWCTVNMGDLYARDPEKLTKAIERSCQLKAQVVAADEKETGLRAILNFGHTFGHAIESYTQYQSWLHGEAVGVGMLMALDMSCRLGHIDGSVVQAFRQTLGQLNVADRPPEGMTADDFIQFMKKDKKNTSEVIRLVLLNSVGEACVTTDYACERLQETLDHFTG